MAEYLVFRGDQENTEQENCATLVKYLIQTYLSLDYIGNMTLNLVPRMGGIS